MKTNKLLPKYSATGDMFGFISSEMTEHVIKFSLPILAYSPLFTDLSLIVGQCETKRKEEAGHQWLKYMCLRTWKAYKFEKGLPGLWLVIEAKLRAEASENFYPSMYQCPLSAVLNLPYMKKTLLNSVSSLTSSEDRLLSH